jgi:DUF971 family protein
MEDLPIPLNDRLERAELLGSVLVLHWRDGHRGEVPLGVAREHCPCALCRDGRAGRRGSSLRMVSPAAAAEAAAIRPIGRYALQFQWRDGHADGIYSFDLLRSICRCPDCAGG